MKTLLRRMRHMWSQIRWFFTSPKITYQQQRKRIMWALRLGESKGKKEALAELPIVQVQPWQLPRQQVTEQLHLPPGEWTRQWRATHGLRTVVLQPLEDDSWLNSTPVDRVPTKKNLLPDDTDNMPALTKALHQRKHAG